MTFNADVMSLVLGDHEQDKEEGERRGVLVYRLLGVFEARRGSHDE